MTGPPVSPYMFYLVSMSKLDQRFSVHKLDQQVYTVFLNPLTTYREILTQIN